MDLISRQEALDAIERIFDRCEEIEAHLPEGDPDRTGYKMYPDYVTVWKYLHQLPSAQSEHTETHSCDYERTETHDLVSRDAVIKAILQLDNLIYTVPDYIDAVRSVPSAEPESRREWYMRGYRDAQPRWIPIKWHDCTAEEREEYGFGEEIVAVFDCDMPSDNQEILVTTSHGYVEKDVCYIDDGYSLDSGYDWIEDITAWMPKPEPYKEGQDE